MLIAALAFARSDAAAQPLTLEYQQAVTRPMPGATAAFSLDPACVGASAQDGVVTLVGRGPGSTNVIVIVGDHTESLQVLVGEPPLTVLPGMGTGGSESAGMGYYEARYGSNPGILQGNLFVSRREGDRSTELTVGGAAPLERDISSPFSVPLASVTVRTPNREMTLLDRVISNSPLTISRSNVRGLHLRQGPWQVNAGYSFFSTFEHLLLPTNKEAVTGVAYRHQLSPRSSITPNFYYFDGPPRRGGGGPLGTLFYETRPASDMKLAAELGVSRSLGGAIAFDVDRPGVRAWTDLRFAPPDLPSLSTEQQSGRQLEAGWIAHGDKSTLNATISSRRYRSGTFDQTSNVASVDLRRRLTDHLTVHGGSGFSLFENGSEAASKIHRFTLPAGASLFHGNVGFDIDYQFSRETTRDLGGHLIRGNLSGTARGFRFNVFGERQTQAPTARQIFTDVPWLQPMLDRLGLAADTPEQLADLLRKNAELSGYGYANSIQIDVTPVRTRVGASGGWSGSGPRRPQLFVSTLFNRDGSIGGTSGDAVHSLNYSQKLDRATEVFLTWSALCRDDFLSFSSCQPVMFASLRRTLKSAPGLFMSRRGRIDGIVFKDDRGWGVYSPGMQPLPGVQVVLDNVRHVITDSFGRFQFDDVSYGQHRVEARYVSDQPTYFTTPSLVEVDTGASVEFGIALSRSSIRGVLRADAGTGVPGVLVQVAGADGRTTVRTGGDGTFVAEGLRPGDYEVTVDASSVPVGYPVDALAPQRVRVEQTVPGRVTFVLRPYRSVAGRARLFNRETGQYVALAGATVELQPLGKRAVTDDKGQYAFRNLPPGEYTIVATRDGREHRTAVSVPDGPAFIKDIDLAVLPASDRAGAAPMRASTAPPRAVSAQAGDERAQNEDGRNARAADAATSGVFTIQVADSTSVRHARAMVSELKDAGHAAYLVNPALSGPNGPYHVRVGRYSTLAAANRSARTLEKTLGWRMSVTAVSAASAAQGSTVSYVR